MGVPSATYRIQLNKHFTFNDLKAILPYLCQLGISHIYASPVFQAKRGSLHGYDITDPNVVNEELGGRSEFEALMQEVSKHGLGWLQDIVPNHASYSLENKRVVDIMIKGADSDYACFFDIDWGYSSDMLLGKLFLPFLAQPLRKCLNDRQIMLVYNDGFKFRYNESEFPVNASTQQHLELNGSIQQTLENYNSNHQLLESILFRQYYQLGHWRLAFRHLNYRRFFDILDLVGVCMENPQAFEESQRLIFELVNSGVIAGLRVDHVDGLYDPQDFLKRLRLRCPGIYLIVEKILTDFEQLPDSWPVDGTTGYEFLNYANKLFVKRSNKQEINALYEDFTGDTRMFSDHLYEAKKAVLQMSFMGDVENLARLFDVTLRRQGHTSHESQGLKAAVIELLVNFPVYRSYLNEGEQDDDSFRLALKLAEKRNPQLAEIFRAIEYMLNNSKTSEVLHALMRFQQFTGAVMAKGFEDTTLYRYTRLISLNEVGSNPDQFGVSSQEFHKFNTLRQENWSRTLNATSTHDTKRGEDVRARINVLAEVPKEYSYNVTKWAKLNVHLKCYIHGQVVPDRCEEYYLYQILLGAYPFMLNADFSERIEHHMIKALREAKIHTNWLEPNLQYEAAVGKFVVEIFNNTVFLESFLAFQKKVAYYGCVNSLAQILLKMTSPGVPDFYQGTELWDLNLVDPDNRRPIDYVLRKKLLADVITLNPSDVSKLSRSFEDGKAKLYLIYKVLNFRKKSRLLFEEGQYLPLTVRGVLGNHIVAFCRRKDKAYALTVVPRFPATLCSERSEWCQESKNFLRQFDVWKTVDWSDTWIILPELAPFSWVDVLSGRPILSASGRLPLQDVLGDFPVALLVGGDVRTV